MATVNRFYNPRQANRINPIGFEELAFVPQQMRQLHDQTQAVAAENAVNQADVLGQDAQLAQELYAPVEKKFNDTIDQLSKNGFSQDIRGNVIGLLGEKKRLERDKISKLESRAASYRENAAAIKEQFKDNPEAMNNRLNALAIANQASATNENGNLEVPGIQDVFRADIMTSEEKQKIANNSMAQLQKRIVGMGLQFDGTFQGFTNAFKSTELGTVTKDRIKNLLRTTLSRDLYNSFKMEGLLNGVGGQHDDKIRAGFQAQIPNDISDEYLVEWYTNHPAATDADVKKAKDAYEQTDEYKENVAARERRFNNSSTEDYYAQYSIDNFITGAANSLAYAQIKNKHFLRADARKLSDYNRAMDQTTSAFPPTLPGIKMDTATMSPLYRETAIADEFNAWDALIGKDDPVKQQVLEEKGWKQTGRYVFDANNNQIPVTMINQALKDKQKVLKNPYTNPKVRKFVDNNESLTSYVNDEIRKVVNSNQGKSANEINALVEEAKPRIYQEATDKVNNFYKNIGSNYNLGIALPSDVVKEVKNLYRGKMGNFKIVHPEKGQMTFNQFLDDADLTAEEFYKTFNPSMSRNVHGQGNMLEVGYMDNDENEAGIFVEPPLNISVNTQKSAKIDEIMVSGKFNQILETNTLSDAYGTDAGKVVEEYVVPNFNNGRVMIKIKDIKTGKFIGQYDFQSLLSEEDIDANEQWRKSFELEGKAN